jgi:hypothetical protein
MTTVKRPEEPPTKKQLDKIKTSMKIDTSRPDPMIVIPLSRRVTKSEIVQRLPSEATDACEENKLVDG